jgi:hypothetical protein
MRKFNTSATKASRQYQQAERQAEELEDMCTRACKRFSLVRVDVAPGRMIAVLERYIEELRAGKEEMLRKYGDVPGIQKALWSFENEQHKALEAIVALKIDALRPGG